MGSTNENASTCADTTAAENESDDDPKVIDLLLELTANTGRIADSLEKLASDVEIIG